MHRIAPFLAACFATTALAGDLLEWSPLPPIPSPLGVAGPYVGVHGDVLLVAGGANFPEPTWESDKAWHDEIYAFSCTGETSAWETAGTLPRPLGYGTTVSLPEGVLCIGGNDADRVYADVFLLSWKGGKVVREDLPSLPEPLCYASAALLGNHIYVAGGQSGPGLETATKTFLRFDWSRRGESDAGWEPVPAWPVHERAFAHLVTVPDTSRDRLFLVGGRHLDENGETEFLADTWEFEGEEIVPPWSRKADLPAPLAAGTAIGLDGGRIVTLAGADGSLFAKADELKDDHPGFPRTSWLYDAATDEWSEAGALPGNQVTTEAVAWNGGFLLASGEIRPRVRTPAVWRIVPRGSGSPPAGPPGVSLRTVLLVLVLGIPLSVLVAWRSRKRKSVRERA